MVSNFQTECTALGVMQNITFMDVNNQTGATKVAGGAMKEVGYTFLKLISLEVQLFVLKIQCLMMTCSALKLYLVVNLY